jgi:AcrR family transcriptional regulator
MPLRRDAEENRERLLAAAREVFAESGFEATMDEVAARAGVGVGTAYRRFANKAELIAALTEDRTAEMARIVDRALAEPDPWQGLVTYLEGWAELNTGDRGLKELFMSSPRSREVLAESRAQVRRRVEKIVARARRAGVLRAGVKGTDIVLVQVMLASLPGDGDVSGPDSWRRMLPLLLDGLRADGAGALPGRALRDAELEERMGWR